MKTEDTKVVQLSPANKVSPFFTQRINDLIEKGEKPLQIAFDAQFLSALVGFDFVKLEDVVKVLNAEVTEFEEEFERIKGKEVDLKTIEELGDVVFSWVNVCRHIGVDPEKLALATVAKYNARCAFIEEELKKDNKTWYDLNQEEIVQIWKKSKKADAGKKEFENYFE